LERFSVAQIGKVCMAINQAWENGHFRKIDYGGARWDGNILANGGDFAVLNQNDLIAEYAACFDVDELAGANGDGQSSARLLRRSRERIKKKSAKKQKRAVCQDFPLGYVNI
jgi:hypothetical protein